MLSGIFVTLIVRGLISSAGRKGDRSFPITGHAREVVWNKTPTLDPGSLDSGGLGLLPLVYLFSAHFPHPEFTLTSFHTSHSDSLRNRGSSSRSPAAAAANAALTNVTVM